MPVGCKMMIQQQQQHYTAHDYLQLYTAAASSNNNDHHNHGIPPPLHNNNNDNDRISMALLQFISSYLDDYGAWEWDFTIIAGMTVVVLGSIRLLFHKQYGIDWYAYIHACIITIGSLTCLYLNLMTSHQLVSLSESAIVLSSSSSSSLLSTSLPLEKLHVLLPEPLRSLQCHGPLTSLHRILPAITMGYSLFDFYDGLTISMDFMIHGIMTFTIMYVFNYIYIAPHIMSPMLFMECSTMFLTTVKATFVPNSIVLLNQMIFTIAFCICRLIVVPYVWVELMMTLYQYRNDRLVQDCIPSNFMYVCFLFGMFYNILNTYWYIKIVKKARRKLLGIEQPKEKNDLIDEADPAAKLVLSSPLSSNNSNHITTTNNKNNNNGHGSHTGNKKSQ